MARSKPTIAVRAGMQLDPASRSTVTPLPGTATIAGLLAAGYLVQVGQTQERIWVATGLPVTPPDIEAMLERSAAGDQAHAAILRATAGRVVLRIQMLAGRVWHPVSDTIAVHATHAAASTFRAPSGYKQTTNSKSTRSTASVPANVGRVTPVAPALGHPHVYALYWGQEFIAHQDWVATLNAKMRQIVQGNYLSWVDQYDSGPGTFDGSAIVNQNPFPGIGGGNFAVIDGFVYGHASPRPSRSTGPSSAGSTRSSPSSCPTV